MAAPSRLPTRVDGQDASHGQRPVAAIALATLLWGMGPVIVKDSHVSGITFGLYRMWVAIPIMWTVVRLTGGRITWPIVRLAIPGGVLFATDVTCGYSSYHYTSIANATLIAVLQPVLLIAIAPRLLGERTRAGDAVLALVAIAGVAVFVVGGGSGGANGWFGDLLAFGSLFAWTAYVLLLKLRRGEGVPAFEYITAVITVGAIALTVPALLIAPDLGGMQAKDWLLVVVMVCVPGMTGHFLFTWANRYVPAFVASLIVLASPVVSAAGAWAAYGESLNATQLAGGVVVLCAIGAIATRAAPQSA